MARTLTHELSAHVGETVTIEGWLHKKRLLGGLNFITLRDRGGLAQTKIDNKDELEKLRGLQVGTVLALTGTVVADERAPGGAELHDVSVSVLVPVTDEPPIEIDKPLDHKSENLDTLFEHRVLGLRNLQETAIFQRFLKFRLLLKRRLVSTCADKILPNSTRQSYYPVLRKVALRYFA